MPDEKECCDKWKYTQVNTVVKSEKGFTNVINIRGTEEAKDTDILFCPECGTKLELYWEKVEEPK